MILPNVSSLRPRPEIHAGGHLDNNNKKNTFFFSKQKNTIEDKIPKLTHTTRHIAQGGRAGGETKEEREEEKKTKKKRN